MTDWKLPFLQYFEEGTKRGKTSALGVELEHFIVDKKTGLAVPYRGENGVRQVLTELIRLYPDAGILPDDDFFGFATPVFTITLEPAAAFEISIAPECSVKRIGKIYRDFYEKLDLVLKEKGYSAVTAGCQPKSRAESLELIPKRRYALMDQRFRQFGTGGMEMMRGTASLQISIDYRSEEDFRRKLQAAYYFGPVLKLFCDNSAAFQGEPLKKRLKRTQIWRRVDPVRCGILPGVFSENYGFSDYTDFLGAMPPIFIKKEQEIIPTGDKTAAQLCEGRLISREEVVHILSMAFPDVRLKQYLEIRFADSVPFVFMLAYCALIKGLFYCDKGISYAERRIPEEGILEKDVIEAENSIMELGWKANAYGRPVRELAEKVLSLAREGLEKEEAEYLNAFNAVMEYEGICNIAPEETEKLTDRFKLKL